jgi:hypothetical protein
VISTLLALAPWLAFSFLMATIVVGPVVGVWLADRPRITAVLLAAGLIAVLAVTLYPDGDPYPTITCSAGLPYLAPTAVESTANILLFVPITLLAGVLWRRPVMAILGGTALSIVIEVVQAVVLVIGRACDTSDWITNTLGAVIGGVLAAVALGWRRRRRSRGPRLSS